MGSNVEGDMEGQKDGLKVGTMVGKTLGDCEGSIDGREEIEGIDVDGVTVGSGFLGVLADGSLGVPFDGCFGVASPIVGEMEGRGLIVGIYDLALPLNLLSFITGEAVAFFFFLGPNRLYC